eukprot:gnl/MRDRNA2_/MRDRNA2_86585_c0_seq3.p1 gnl/MRDRNA2_/MRDRNA2_86585_c0~~gnl/MRDRNA2_/MRDRNA2_86585_c0_seq3.p1  ORF type:complete len:385 (+),score=8.70 gnl/MRDRNA2_/MRDRNA2_86585_c0_seq3:102-1256(+)
MVDLSLGTDGNYCLDLAKDGETLAAASMRGHIATIQRQKFRLGSSMQVGEAVFDIKFLKDGKIFAVARKKAVYIYDCNGIEIHCLKNHSGALKLAFIRHQMLIASIGYQGILRYQDSTTGKMTVQHETRRGTCDVMGIDHAKGVLCLGHNNGKTTLWTPNLAQPIVEILSHRGRVVTIATDPAGFQLLSTGEDLSVKVWDMRNFNIMQHYKSKNLVTCSDLSRNGLVGLGWGRQVHLWKVFPKNRDLTPYLSCTPAHASLRTLLFHEDCVICGHSDGIMSRFVPGCTRGFGDVYDIDHVVTKKHLQEIEVLGLLEKLPPYSLPLMDIRANSTSKKSPEMISGRKSHMSKKIIPKEAKGLVLKRDRKLNLKISEETLPKVKQSIY